MNAVISSTTGSCATGLGGIALAGRRRAASARPNHHMPNAMMMTEAMMPRPGAAKVVVPKYAIGMALFTEGVPASPTW